MLQLRHEIQPRTEVNVSPHIVVRSVLLELDYVDLSKRIEQELAENPALDVEINSDNCETLPVGPPTFPVFSGFAGQYSGEDFPLDTIAQAQTLQSQLLWQYQAIAPPAMHTIGEILIASIDDDGYLTADIFRVAEDLGVPLEKVQSALDYVQQLSPAGVGARSLCECLQLQLRDRQRAGESIPEEVKLVVQHLGHCGHNIEQGLAKATNLTISQVGDALEYIRRNFYPYPGQQFHTGAAQQSDNHQIYPDAIVYYDGKDLSVEIPQGQAYALRINHAYLRLERAIKQAQISATPASDIDPDQVEAIQQQIRAARRFIEMLEQRHVTMQLVTETIVKRQKAMFTQGIKALRPLNKKDIAREIGLHESTVSRATRGKYIMMPDGALLPFAVFFEDALPTKALIAQIIKQEDVEKPLTDKQLGTILAEKGYQLARRTITKYRKQMGIPSSRRRDGTFSFSSVYSLG